MINENMEIKIGDFGLAAKLEHPTERRKTICGTPNYLAPEIIKDKQYGVSVDWYSLGLVVYEMISGMNPFKTGRETTFVDQMNMILQTEIKMPPYFSKEASDFISNLLEKIVSKKFLTNFSLLSEQAAALEELKR